MDTQKARTELKAIMSNLRSTDRIFHLDDSPSEFRCFTQGEAERLASQLKAIRNVLTEDEVWEIFARYA